MPFVKSTIITIKSFYKNKIDSFDLDLLIAHVLKKEREFILIHPEHILTSNQQSIIGAMIDRRLKNEPLAYILGEKEFYSLNFKINRHTLIPRPETELMVEMALENIKAHKHAPIKTLKHNKIKTTSTNNNTTIHQSSVIDVIDIGTGSGNIVISLAHNINYGAYAIEHGTWDMKQKEIKKYKLKNTDCKNITSVNCAPKTVNYFATDISLDALKIAKQNAKLHNVNKKIKFLHGNLLSPFLKSKIINHKSSLLILANLPYLSKDIYDSCADNVRKYEPKSALYSANCGLAHYITLLPQIKLLATSYKLQATILMEISPEQKKILPPITKKIFPQAKIEFKKDLAQKWRVCKITI